MKQGFFYVHIKNISCTTFWIQINLMILSTFMTKRNWEQPSESKQLSSFLYLYHKIFWRTSFRIQAESFMVFPSFMLKTIEAGHSESKHFYFFFYVYDKSIWRTDDILNWNNFLGFKVHSKCSETLQAN